MNTGEEYTMSTDVYQIITDRITSLLGQGVAPWQKPWNVELGQPRNLISGKPYRGVNTWLLSHSNYSSPLWATFNQVKDKGGNVRRGEKSTPIVFWKTYDSEDKDTGETKKRFILRYFNVFNTDQTDGLKLPALVKEERIHTPIELCEKLVGGYPRGPLVVHGGDRAFYRPSEDIVHMPTPESFTATPEYYSTIFHEMIHATGHKSRLDRATLKDAVRFGDTSYAREELVAEMGAAYLCGIAGIENNTINNSAAYLAGWKKALRDDTKCLVIAAGQAQKAADYIQGKSETRGEEGD